MVEGLSWQNEARSVLLLNLGRNWTWEVFEALMAEAHKTIRETPHMVDLIVDDEGDETTLPSGPPLRHFRRAVETLPPNLRHVYIPIHQQFTRLMVDVVAQISPPLRQRLITVKSRAEALQKAGG